MRINTINMKIASRILLLAMVSLLTCFCGGKKKQDQESLMAPKGMKYIDISRTGMNLYVLSPDSTRGELDTVMQSNGEYQMKVGKDFQISVLEGPGDVAQKKADITNDDVNKLKKYVIDDGSTLLWESGIADISEFHFMFISKVGERSYIFEDIKGEPFSQDAIQKMLDACKQSKEKKNQKAES